MSDQRPDPIFFEIVTLPERCSLGAALLWVAVKRPPKMDYPDDEYIVANLAPDLCEALGIPEPPQNASHYWTHPEVLEWQCRNLSPKDEKRTRKAFRGQGYDEYNRWRELLARAVEPCAAELYLALRKGRLSAQGKMLPNGVAAEIFIANDRGWGAGDARLNDLRDDAIPPDFWTQAGIDWLSHAVVNSGQRYCDITLSVAELLSAFPSPRSAVELPVYLLGNNYLMVDLADQPADTKIFSRGAGRPPQFQRDDWDAFHVEVGCMLKRGDFPEKREAAIATMTDWFTRRHGRAPGRTTIGDKLTLYYRALRAGGYSDENPDENSAGNSGGNSDGN